MKPQFLIAAPSSNSGKTLITLGLLKVLKSIGLDPQPFKCGPDYLDTKHHSNACDKPGINLDLFMMDEGHIKEQYHRYIKNAGSAIVEGVMGLFDGSDKMKSSSAELAILLDLPVILIVNAKSMAYSAAPLLFGFKNFDPRIKIAGVIFNFVGSQTHFHILKEAAAEVGIETLGYLPFNEKMIIPSRHLGLTINSSYDFGQTADQASTEIKNFIDIPKLITLTSHSKKSYPITKKQLSNPISRIKIAVANDDAFNFIYHQNIEVLQQKGDVIYFSPLNDKELPVSDLLYLPGGYPELYLEQLSSNKILLNQIREFCERGGKVLAECGGLMYLGKKIIDKNGEKYPMVDFFNIETSMEKPKLSLGYRSFSIGYQEVKGHEFHYSTLADFSEINSLSVIYDARKRIVNSKIFRKKNVIASYIHLYWGNNEDLLENFFHYS